MLPERRSSTFLPLSFFSPSSNVLYLCQELRYDLWLRCVSVGFNIIFMIACKVPFFQASPFSVFDSASSMTRTYLKFDVVGRKRKPNLKERFKVNKTTCYLQARCSDIISKLNRINSLKCWEPANLEQSHQSRITNFPTLPRHNCLGIRLRKRPSPRAPTQIGLR